MKCPVCHDVKMREVVKEDVLIDICPECKGVWLDRGELDKLMTGIREFKQHSNYQDIVHNYDKHYSQNNGHYKHKKKKHVLDVFGDLFD